MQEVLQAHLNILTSMAIQKALRAITDSFGTYIAICLDEVTLSELEDLVNRVDVNQDTRQFLRRNLSGSNPHKVLMDLFFFYKDITISKGKYARINSDDIPISQNWVNQESTGYASDRINAYVSSLSFENGIAYLGELLGAWMLTCPESMVRADSNFEWVGARLGAVNGEWKVPKPFKRRLVRYNPELHLTEDEWKTLFVLDTFLYLATEHWFSTS